MIILVPFRLPGWCSAGPWNRAHTSAPVPDYEVDRLLVLAGGVSRAAIDQAKFPCCRRDGYTPAPVVQLGRALEAIRSGPAPEESASTLRGMVPGFCGA